MVAMNPSEIGERTEAVILAELVKRGYRPLLPFGNSRRYDFVLDTGDGFITAQCKTGRIRNGVIVFTTASKTKLWSEKKVIDRSYRGEVDMFLVLVPDTEDIYMVPVSQVGIGKGYLRVEPTQNGQQQNVLWAKDFLLGARM